MRVKEVIMEDIKAVSVFVSAIFGEKSIQCGLCGEPYLGEDMWRSLG